MSYEVEWALSTVLFLLLLPLLTLLHVIIVGQRILQSLLQVLLVRSSCSGRSSWSPSDRRVIVLVGASSGIGAAFAQRLAEEQSVVPTTLILCARRRQELEEVAELCRKRGGTSKLKVETHLVDIGNADDVRYFMREKVMRISRPFSRLIFKKKR